MVDPGAPTGDRIWRCVPRTQFCHWASIDGMTERRYNTCVDEIGSGSDHRRRAILFDIGDTLLPASAIARSALETTAQKLCGLGLLRDVDRFLSVYRIQDLRHTGPSVNHLFSGLDICLRAAEAVGAPRPLLLGGAFLAAYRDAVRCEIQYAPELVAQFEKLRSSGVGIGAVTDGTTVEQTETLYRLGIVHLVDALVVSEEVGKEKPAREMFERALAELGVDRPSDALMVGDSCERDIAGARALGIRTAWLSTSAGSGVIQPAHSDADYTITSLRDLGYVMRDLGMCGSGLGLATYHPDAIL